MASASVLVEGTWSQPRAFMLIPRPTASLDIRADPRPLGSEAL